ncbi:hypothetical protein CTEN210_00451 [Chaetoceros tenuissimus]|uniref:Uncharacterized protein n=1 Tax=Chaetoceros tenuissimus TaxID=426638 RepID=A0AAD3CD98_9STRA|nr:hypothetical protein CTEN210_00451 [Chaetoceros tenuissimus]
MNQYTTDNVENIENNYPKAVSMSTFQREFSNHLGDLVDRAKVHVNLNKQSDWTNDEMESSPNKKSKESHRYVQPWIVVIAALIGMFVLVEGGLFIAVTTLIDPHLTALNEPKFQEFDNPFEDIVEHTIPFIKEWVEREIPSDVTTLLASQDAEIEPREGNTDCLEKYFADLQTHIPTTSPKYVDLVLRNLGDHFYRSPIIRKALGAYLSEAQSLDEFYSLSNGCLERNIPFLNVVCAINDVHPYEDPFSNFSSRVAIEYAVNFAAVVEILTKYISTDLQAVNEMSIAITTSRLDDMILNVEEKTIRNSLAENEFVFGFDATKSLQLNILEAVKLDISLGRKENALVGIALAADSYVGEYIQSFELLDRLSKEYIDTYISWNFAFIIGSATKASGARIGKLFIPSVSCTSDPHYSKRFLTNRSISLGLALMHIYKSPVLIQEASLVKDTLDKDEVEALNKFYQDFRNFNTTFTMDSNLNLELAHSLGKGNFKNFLLSDPSMDTVHKMLNELCGKYCGTSMQATESVPTSYLNDNDFAVYLGLINWITVVLTGFGLEVFMILVYINQKWSPEHESQWRMAQFLFS